MSLYIKQINLNMVHLYANITMSIWRVIISSAAKSVKVVCLKNEEKQQFPLHQLLANLIEDEFSLVLHCYLYVCMYTSKKFFLSIT